MVQIQVPSKLNKRQRELLEAFAEESGEVVTSNGHGGILERVRDALG
jgi:DnaJ-class molecular chaperone